MLTFITTDFYFVATKRYKARLSNHYSNILTIIVSKLLEYQNRIKRKICTRKRRVLMDEEELLTDRVKLTRLNQEYRPYNKAMGFKSREERLGVIG